MNYRNRKKKNEDNQQTTNQVRENYDYSKQNPNGSVGLSEKALKDLESGNYQGRQVQYKTSADQLQQSRQIPALTGMIYSSNNDPETNNVYNAGIDPTRARQNYANKIGYTPLGQEEQKETTSRDENYVVKRDRYDKLMKDSRLANDIKTLAEVNYKNANQDATVSQEWADEYGAKKITGGYSKSQFIDTLSRRYGLTPKELNDMALTFHSDSYKKENEEYGKNLEKIGKDHALLGSAGSLVGTIGSGFEGMYNAAVGGLTGDDRYLSNIFSTTKNKPREGAKQNIKSDLGKGAYDVVMGIGDMAAGAATGSAPVILAGNTANEAMSSAMERGSGVRRSATYGTAAGLLDFVTNKIGLDAAKKKAVDSIKSTGIKKFLKQNAIAGLGEAGENIIQDIGQSFFDAIINGKNSELSKSYADKVASGMSEDDAFSAVAKEYVGQLGMSGALGFGMGSAMQGGATILPKVPELVGQKLAYNNVGAIDPTIREILFGDDGLPKVEKAAQQTADAKAEIENLSQQIPETPVSYADELRESFESAKPVDKAHMLVDAGYYRDMVQAGKAYKAGQLDADVEDFLSKMERNGNPTPTKATLESNETGRNELESKYGGDWTAMRRGTVQELTGADDSKTDEYMKALGKYMNGKYPTEEDTAVLDDYIDHAPTYQGQISRGMHYDVGDGGYDAFMNRVHESGVVTLDKPSSWTTEPETARIYSHMGDDNADSIEIVCNQNRTSTPIDFINTMGESEVLSHSKASWTVLNEDTVTRPNGARKTILYVAETGDKTPPKDAAVIPEQNTQTMNESTGLSNPTLTETPNGGEPISNNPDNPPMDNGKGRSKVITNSAYNAGVVTQEQIDSDPVIKSIMEYDKHNNQSTLDAATKNVTANGERLLEDFNSGKVEINSDQTVDESFLLLRSLTKQIEDLGENAPDDLIQKKNLLLSRLRQAGTKYGQTIQAFAKWNKTPDGALVNGQKILADRTKQVMSHNKKAAERNNKIAEELDNIGKGNYDTTISNDGGYKKAKGKSDAEKTSSRLDKALRQQGYDGSMESEPKAPKTHEQHRVEVENSIRKELGSVADQFNDNDFEYLTSLVENKVPVDIITDEIEHRLNHGEWYTIDESTPVKKATSSKLSKILKNMGDDSLKEKNRPQETGYPKKSHATISEEVVNTLEKEAAGLGLDTPTDIEFLTMMIEEKVPDWQIEDEINHRLMTGEWYTLDESIEPKVPVNQKLRNALNSLVDTEEKPPKAELSFEELRDQVKRTLSDENASAGTSRLYTDQGDFTDSDIDYITNLIRNGATKAELADALNTKLATGTFGISADTEMKVNDLFKYAEKSGMNSKTGIEAMMAAYKLIADETVGKASAFEKFEAWRYLAMLGNTKTMVRNMVGNVMFNGVTDFSNGLSALIESGVDKALKKRGGIQRQKAILNPTKDAGLISTAWKDGTQNRWSEIGGTAKYEKGVKDAIKSQKSVFDSKLLQLYERATDAGISDEKFVHTKYATSLAGYLKANGLGEDAFRAEPRYNKLLADSQTRVLTNAERAEMDSLKQTMDTLEKARDYAIKQAEYATFHEDNAVAQWLTKNIQEARNSDSAVLRGIGTIAEGVLPFKKTPANILKSGVEYSPLGAIKSIAETGKLIYENTGKRKGNLEDVYQKTNKLTGKTKDVSKSLASDVIESWSKTLTGSGLAMLGYYLADKGILRASGKDEKYQNDLEGKQQYSIEINGKTYTVDWAAPAVMPMLLGAEANKIAQENLVSNESVFKDIDKTMGTMNALLDPILETSFMQGVQNALESAANQVRYSNDDSGGLPGGIAGAFASNALTSYATQGIPTFLGQIARTVDPIRRSTDTATDSNFLSEWEKTARKTANKIPFLSQYVNQPYYDAYGRTQNNSPFENPLANFAYQALSPAYVADINETDADKSAREAYNGLVPTLNENGETVMKPVNDAKAFASWKNKVTINGEKLDPQQIAEYRRTTGMANYEIRSALAQEDWFNNLSPDKQTDILKKVNTLVDKVGKSPYVDGTGKDYEAYQSGGLPSLLDYYKGNESKKAVEEETGLKSNTNASKAIVEQVQQGNQEVANQMIADAKTIEDYGFTKPGPIETYYKASSIDPNMSVDDFVSVYNDIDGADGSEPNQGIKKTEILAYLNSSDYTEQEGLQIWEMFRPANAKKVPELKKQKDGTYVWK